MPTKKPNTFRRRLRRTARKFFKGYDAWDLAKDAYKGVKYLKGIINSEKHYHLITTLATPDYNGTVTALSFISQGDDTTARTGRSILAKSLAFNWSASMGAGDASFTIYICRDTSRLLSGSIPTCSDLLTSTGTIYAPISTILNDSQGRFKILKKFRGNVHNNKPRVEGKCYLRLNHHIKFDGTAATTADANVGHIFVFFISDSLGGAGDPQIIFQSKLQFYDN